MPPSTCQALVQIGGDAPKLVKKDIPVPTPEAHQALIKVSYVAQNPTDVQAFDSNAYGDGTILGCDFVGTVEQLGNGPANSNITEGSTIAGLIWGGEIKGLGGYSQYTIADKSISFPVPASISPESAATIPLAACTSWLALFSEGCLNIDRASKAKVLIWGGSSSVGLFAIQLAALYDLEVVATCSPRNFDLVKSLGAKHVFDYRDESVVEKIKAAAPGLKYVFDTIGNSTSSKTASETIDPSGGGLTTVRPGKVHTEQVTKWTKVTDVLVWTAFLKEHRFKAFQWPASKADHELSTELFRNLPKWLEEGKVKPNPVKVLQGLDAVPEGFQLHRDQKVSAFKIVYKI